MATLVEALLLESGPPGFETNIKRIVALSTDPPEAYHITPQEESNSREMTGDQQQWTYRQGCHRNFRTG